MQVGIFAKTFAAQGAANSLGAVRAAGYDVAQFNMSCVGLAPMPDFIAQEVTRAIAEAASATGVAVAAVSGTYNMIHPDPSDRELGMRRLGILIAAARNMGTPLVTLCTGTRDTGDQWRHHPDNQGRTAWRDLLREMEKAVNLAERYGVFLGIEPELANVVNSADAARRLIAELGSPSVRVVLDPANLFEVAGIDERGSIIQRAVDLLGPYIVMAHAKDRNPSGEFVAPGKGVIDFPAFIGFLRTSGFAGPVVAHGIAEGEAGGVAAFLRSVITG